MEAILLHENCPPLHLAADLSMGIGYFRVLQQIFLYVFPRENGLFLAVDFRLGSCQHLYFFVGLTVYQRFWYRRSCGLSELVPLYYLISFLLLYFFLHHRIYLLRFCQEQQPTLVVALVVLLTLHNVLQYLFPVWVVGCLSWYFFGCLTILDFYDPKSLPPPFSTRLMQLQAALVLCFSLSQPFQLVSKVPKCSNHFIRSNGF